MATTKHITEIEQIRPFLARYSAFVGGLAPASIEQFSVALLRITPRLAELSAKAHEHIVSTAPDFNVYNVLHLGRRETIVHTPMLQHLLNPKASHAQGSLFLKSFFTAIGDVGIVPPSDDFNEPDWTTRRDLTTEYGNLDLIVRCKSRKYLMVIENKVDAVEQKKQLSRYNAWMQTQKQSFPNQDLVYLTRRGGESDTVGNARYHRLSYSLHIHRWLNDCLPKIQAPAVQEVLRQYLKIIESF